MGEMAGAGQLKWHHAIPSAAADGSTCSSAEYPAAMRGTGAPVGAAQWTNCPGRIHPLTQHLPTPGHRRRCCTVRSRTSPQQEGYLSGRMPSRDKQVSSGALAGFLIRSAFWGTVRTHTSPDNVHTAMALPVKRPPIQWPSCGDSVAPRAGRPRSSALCSRVELLFRSYQMQHSAQLQRTPQSWELPAGA